MTTTASASASTVAGARDGCPVCRGPAAGSRTVVRAGAVATCGRCGTWFRVPRPTLEELLRIYNQDYYKPWGMGEDASVARATKLATFEPLLIALDGLVGTDRPRSILDVGAATGLLLELAESRGWTPFALELNPYSAGVLRERYGAERVFEGELTARPFEPARFDAITMTDLIEHVLDVRGTLRAAAELLRPGGVLCITTPRIDSLSRWSMGATWLHFKEEHIQYFTAGALRAAMERNGFTQVHIAPYSKRLTLDYVHHQLQVYPHRWLTPLVTGVRRVLPAAVRRRPVGYRCGEMVAFGVRSGE